MNFKPLRNFKFARNKGAVAQLGERQNRTLEVASSNLVCSIPIFLRIELKKIGLIAVALYSTA